MVRDIIWGFLEATQSCFQTHEQRKKDRKRALGREERGGGLSLTFLDRDKLLTGSNLSAWPLGFRKRCVENKGK